MADLDVFRDDYVPNAEGAAYHAKWVRANPGEAAQWAAFRDAVLAGESPVPPELVSKYGRALIAAAVMALPEATPPPDPEPEPEPEPIPTPTPSFPNSPIPAWYRRAQWKAPFSKRNGVHYVGDEVVIDLTFVDLWYDTFKCTGDFEQGMDGATIATTHRGGWSPYYAVVGAPTYDSTHAYGSLAMKIDGAEYVRWIYAPATDEYIRLYLYATAFPTTHTLICAFNYLGGVRVSPSGKLQMIGDYGANGIATSASIALNQWVRIEGKRPGGGGTTYELKLFNDPDSETPTESRTDDLPSPSQQNGTRFGTVDGDWGSAYWLDNLVARGPSWAGPYSASEPAASPITYTVRDYFGAVVSSGTFDEHQTWFKPVPPPGGWKPGWYRVYLSGPNHNSTFGKSYGATNFCVIRRDARFISMPSATISGGNDPDNDLVMKGVMGLGTSRLSIRNPADPAELARVASDASLSAAYWSNNGLADVARPPRRMWCAFPNNDSSAATLSAISNCVAALYPLGVTHFEGPRNEPPVNADTAQKMALFRDAVKAGHPDAKAIGPCPVSLSGDWDGFFAAGGGEACDEFAVHAYNSVTSGPGDLNLGRHVVGSFMAMLASKGYGSKPVWQTESTQAMTSVYRIYHPRRARKMLLEILLWEQFGVPRERNCAWYDVSHGFWSFPAWLANGDGSLEPQAVMGRQLAEETWGKPFASALDFGRYGNNIFLGNVYAGSSGKTVALMSTSFMENASVTLSISGAPSPVSVVDGLGNVNSVPLSGGTLTVRLTELPSYVRLPSSASVSVHHVNDWPAGGVGASFSPSASVKEIDGVSQPAIADDGWMTRYPAQGIAPSTWATPPSVIRLGWSSAKTVSRVLVWCGPTWQSSGTLLNFSVDTTSDGANWVTRKVVSKPRPRYLVFGTDSSNSGCFLETYWDEQWVFDVKLDSPVSCSGLRISVSDASYGGEPMPASDFGQGNSGKAFRIQEIAVV